MVIVVSGPRTVRVKHRRGSARTLILDLAIRSPKGVTCDEAEAKLGLTHQTASAAITAMLKANMLTYSGHRRLTRSGRMAKAYCRKR